MEKRFLSKIYLFTVVFLSVAKLNAQVPELKIKFNESGDHFFKFTFLNQTWIRFNQSNPGTTVLGEDANQTFDLGLRRTRMQMFGQITDRLFVYTQFGMNNFNFLSSNGGNRKLQAFFHDALGEYVALNGKNTLKFGAGLTICNGLSRFSQPSVGTIMSLDVPVFAQTTVDQTDEFSRKLSVYARGQFGKLDYRVVLSDPFPVSTNGQSLPVLNKDATFSLKGHHHQAQALLIWNVLDREPHTTPYMTGTFLGKKKVWNLEAGIVYQEKATWRTENSDTLYEAMMHWSVASFLDIPLNQEKGTAFNAYLGYFRLNYGKNYLRNNGVMNPANGVNSQASFNGTGNAFPMFGTGSVIYAQAGYLMRKDILGKFGTLMPYANCTYANYEKLSDPMVLTEAGVNWLMAGHAQKLSLGWQNRPVFSADVNGELRSSGTRNMFVLQYQVSL